MDVDAYEHVVGNHLKGIHFQGRDVDLDVTYYLFEISVRFPMHIISSGRVIL